MTKTRQKINRDIYENACFQHMEKNYIKHLCESKHLPLK